MSSHRHTSTPPAPERSPLLTIREAAAYLKCGTSTLYNRLDQLDHVKLGKRSLITRASLDAFIARSIIPAKADRPQVQS